jgi:hypothetical protein
VTISERAGAGRRERRVLTRVSRAGWRLEQAGRERVQALVSARAEGSRFVSWPRRPGCHRRGCTSSWQAPGLDVLDAALGELRAAGWPAPEDPDSTAATASPAGYPMR